MTKLDNKLNLTIWPNCKQKYVMLSATERVFIRYLGDAIFPQQYERKNTKYLIKICITKFFEQINKNILQYICKHDLIVQK